VRLFTVHAPAPRPASALLPKSAPAPVLLAEGFCLSAALFGSLWFLWQRLWLEAAAMLALSLAAGQLPDPFAAPALLALHLLAGFEARDRLRARLARRGRPLQGVVAAPDLESAWFRLAQQRPELIRSLP
jgi:hypothetical protein